MAKKWTEYEKQATTKAQMETVTAIMQIIKAEARRVQVKEEIID